MSLARVIQRVQTLYDDQGETWCDKDYVTGFIAINSEDLEARLAALDLSYEEDYVVLSAVPAGTADLSTYQAEGGALDDMMSITALEWRRVGETDDDWAPVRRVDKVVDTDAPGNPVEGILSYSWKRGLVKISKSSIDLDLRVTAELLPAVLQSDSDNYIKGMTNVLSYWTAELIGQTRGGPISKLADVFARRGLSALDDVLAILTKQEQSIVRRIGGRRSRTRGPNWRIPTA